MSDIEIAAIVKFYTLLRAYCDWKNPFFPETKSYIDCRQNECRLMDFCGRVETFCDGINITPTFEKLIKSTIEVLQTEKEFIAYCKHKDKDAQE